MVVDASVAFKWTQPGSGEPGAGTAMAVLQDHLAGRILLHVPSLIFHEVANGLLLGRARPAAAIIEQALGWLFDLSLQVAPPTSEALVGAARISRDLGVTVYDAAYVALARSLHCEFVTADRRLARRVDRNPTIRLVE